MKLVKSISELQAALGLSGIKGLKIGFVPTMGALHEGHLSLVQQAGQENDLVVVSVFVNPTQFNDKADLERYPRTLEADAEKLSSLKCDFIFAPSVEEIYPEPDTRKFNFGDLETVMEGKFRPGHFNGVAQVVSRLFDIVKPDRAYFGMKDFQQLAIIKSMVKQLNLPVEIVPVEIKREKDGLAMSSRNMLLQPEYRKEAPKIYQALLKIRELKENNSVEEVRDKVTAEIEKGQLLKVEYLEIVDEESLQPVKSWNQDAAMVACIAVFAGKIRLIDNIRL
jgi:pantoate--beta-alanine ligase